MRNSLIAITIGLLFAAPAAACNYPKNDLSVPNGATAAKAEMLEAKQALKTYLAAMETYLACLEPRMTPVLNEISESAATINTMRYNAAVEEMQSAAERYNVEVRTYKKREEDN